MRAAAIPAAILFVGIAAHPAAAQSAAANVEAYCTQKYGAGTLATFDRRDNGAMCSEKTSQGLGLLHHKIDPADICTAQQKTSQFRLEGRQILCLTGNETIAPDRKVDLADFCRRNYGQSAIVSKRLTDNQPLCTVKGAGGLSQTHYAIDLAQLCGVGGKISSAAVEADTLDCAKRGVEASAGSAGKAGSSNGAGKGKPPSSEQAPSGPKQAGAGIRVPDTAIIPASDKPDLTGCGIPPSPELLALGWGKEYASFLSPSFNVETDLAPGSKRRQELAMEFANASMWMSGGDLTPCASLSGGLIVEVADICRLNPVNPMLGWVGSSPESTARHYPRPVCHAPDAEPNPTYIGTPLVDGCSAFYPDQDTLRRAGKDQSGNDIIEGWLYPIMKWTGTGQIECFYLDVSENYEIDFVTADAPYDMINDLTAGTNFRVRLVFTTTPSRATKKVTVTNKRSGQTIELVAEQTRESKIFLTPPVTVVDEVEP